jgi:predicted Zn-dependent protease
LRINKGADVKVVFTSVLALAILASAGCTKTASDYVEIGNAAFAEKRYEDAAIAYRKALQKTPGHADASYPLALAHLRQGNTREAFQQLRQTLQHTPSHKDAAAQLADLTLASYLASGGASKSLYDSATQLVTGLLKADPNSPDAWRLQGYLLQTDKKLVESEAAFRRAVAGRPGNPQILTGLADTLLLMGRISEAESVAAEVIALRKDYQPIYDLLVGFYSKAGLPADVERTLQSRVTNNPNEGSAAAQLAGFYLRQGRRPDAQAWLDRIAGNPNIDMRYAVAGDVWLNARMFDQAIAVYRSGLGAEKDKSDLYTKKIVNALIQQGKSGEALQLSGELVRKNPKNRESRMVHAGLLARSDEQNSLDAAIAEYRSLIADDSADARAYSELGKALVRKGDVAGAKQAFASAVKHDAWYVEPRLQLAGLARATRQFKDVRKHADDVLQIQPANPEARLLKAVAQRSLGEAAEARATLSELAVMYPVSHDVAIELALLDLSQNRYKDAEQRVRRVYTAYQPDKRPLATLVDALLGQGRGADAIALIAPELGRAPQSVELRALYARTALGSGRLDVALQKFSELATEYPNNALMHSYLGAVHRSRGDLAAAAESYKRAASVDRNDPQLTAMQAYLEGQLGQQENAARTYQASLSRSREDPLLLNNMAYTLAEVGNNLDEALRLAQLATQKAPDNPYYSDTLGWVYFKRNNLDDADRIFGDLTRRYPNITPFRYHYAITLNARGDRISAKSHLNAALSRTRSHQEADMIRQLLKKIG